MQKLVHWWRDKRPITSDEARKWKSATSWQGDSENFFDIAAAASSPIITDPAALINAAKRNGNADSSARATTAGTTKRSSTFSTVSAGSASRAKRVGGINPKSRKSLRTAEHYSFGPVAVAIPPPNITDSQTMLLAADYNSPTDQGSNLLDVNPSMSRGNSLRNSLRGLHRRLTPTKRQAEQQKQLLVSEPPTTTEQPSASVRERLRSSSQQLLENNSTSSDKVMQNSMVSIFVSEASPPPLGQVQKGFADSCMDDSVQPPSASSSRYSSRRGSTSSLRRLPAEVGLPPLSSSGGEDADPATTETGGGASGVDVPGQMMPHDSASLARIRQLLNENDPSQLNNFYNKNIHHHHPQSSTDTTRTNVTSSDLDTTASPSSQSQASANLSATTISQSTVSGSGQTLADETEIMTIIYPQQQQSSAATGSCQRRSLTFRQSADGVDGARLPLISSSTTPKVPSPILVKKTDRTKENIESGGGGAEAKCKPDAVFSSPSLEETITQSVSHLEEIVAANTLKDAAAHSAFFAASAAVIPQEIVAAVTTTSGGCLMTASSTSIASTAGKATGTMSVKTERRRLRFLVPQSSVTSVDELLASSAEMSKSGASVVMSPPAAPSGAYDNELGPASTSSMDQINFDYNGTVATSQLQHLPRSSVSSYTNASPSTSRRKLSDASRRRASAAAARRQSNVQFVQKAVGRRTSTTLIPLTSAQIHLVRALWRQVYITKGPTVIGQTVMHRLFFKCPKLKELFRTCPVPNAQHFTNHDYFAKYHCKSIGELIDLTVENLDDLQNIEVDLVEVGRSHARIISGQLSSKIWNSVAETFIDCTLEWGDRRCRSETVRKAWALIIAYVTEKIKHGHSEERKLLLAMNSTITSLERFAVAPSTTAANPLHSSSLIHK